jgi:hypothetical protein
MADLLEDEFVGSALHQAGVTDKEIQSFLALAKS